MLKTIFYNLLVFFTLANLFYWSIPVVDLIQSLHNNAGKGGAVYRSFIEWRSAEVHLPGSNVEGPYLQRRTVADSAPSTRKIWFFGGSTMWGSGDYDADTIPSKFAARTGTAPDNFAEIGWTAHQGLLYLIQLLQDGRRPDLVVFMDGVNDVAAKCVIGHSPTSHGKETEFSGLVTGVDRPQSFAYMLRPVLRLSQRISQQISGAAGASPYDCDTNPAKAEMIAANLLSDWKLARQIVELYGGRFHGFLQPVAYFSRTNVAGLALSKQLGDQFSAVYPLVKQKLAADPAFHDLATVLDGEESVYLDFCHINAEGNMRVAQRIAEAVDDKERVTTK
jgi:lysophospholipase L1-like esterase